MTDFLGRVAARAVGAAAVAQPRLPGLFERADAAGDATLEVVEEEVVVRQPPSSREEETAAAAPSAPPLPPAAAAVGEPAGHRTELVESRPPEALAPAPASPTGAMPPERAPVRAEAVAVATPEPPPESASRAAVVAAPLAQALPAPRVGVPSNSLSLGSAPGARDEPPPVRVHIGRLEVRANLQPAALEPPRRERPRPEGLALADYLRGKREVRS